MILIWLIAAIALSSNPTKQKDNKLSKAEKKQGWQLLFDGKSLSHWKNFNKETLDPRWQIENGCITLTEKGGGDIVTREIYENFELELEWKISEGGNSGIFFHVLEGEEYKATYQTGPEMQILDDDKHKDAKTPAHKAGAAYGLFVPPSGITNPVGTFNHVRIKVMNGHVQHYLNGHLTADYILGSDEWKEIVSKTKFAAWPMYGMGGKGKIALQDHGDKVWFKNIKIKRL
jgi:hypothetical protein